MDGDHLIIKEIKVDTGPIHKKQKIKSRGRADLQKRRTSHISIVLIEEKTKKAGLKKSRIIKSVKPKNKTRSQRPRLQSPETTADGGQVSVSDSGREGK